MLPIVLGNFARQSRRRSSLLGEWLAPTLKFSEIAIATPTPSHDGNHDTNAETLRRNV